jgi:NTE family protein
MLALEGGGGKGAAYLGALGVFADPAIGLLKAATDGRTEGAVLDKSRVGKISGSSAGAITATLVACGYSLEEIVKIVTSEHLRSFYDLPQLLRPRVGQNLPAGEFFEPSLNPTGSGVFARQDDQFTRERFDEARDPAGASRLLSRVIRNWLMQRRASLLKLPTALQFLLGVEGNLGERALPEYVRSLLTDFGFMSGIGARKAIDALIAQKTVIGQTTTHGITFSQFVKHHGVELFLTGTRLETGTFHYFSAKTTPHFAVADAVRISMSIPVLFKPVVIRPGDFPGDELVGTWVDGGMLNNLPIHAFDDAVGAVGPNVLGLRLGLDRPRSIKTFAGFMSALVETLLSPGELGQIRTVQEQMQTIVLPTGRLSTAEFLAPRDVLREAVHQSAMATMRYFGLEETTSSFLVNNFGVRRLEKESLLAPP